MSKPDILKRDLRKNVLYLIGLLISNFFILNIFVAVSINKTKRKISTRNNIGK